MSENWFEWYVKEASKIKEWAVFRDRFLCPCCFMPTLEERCGYDICPICFWEDDGQDSDDANIVRGGPNSDYSLTEARSNFEKYKTMYRVSDTRPFKFQNKTKAERMRIYNAFVRSINSKREEDWNTALVIESEYYEDRV